MEKIKVSLFYFLACLSFSACGGGKTLHWSQEALLQDGRVIIVERISERTGTIVPENVSMEKSQKISFSNPDTNERITFDVPTGLLPFAIDVEDKVPYLVLSAYTVGDYNRWNCPNPPYLVYRYDSGRWITTPFDQLPKKMIVRNLIDMSKEFQRFSKGDLLTLGQHQKWLKDLPKDRRTINREKIKAGAEGCFPSVLEKLGRPDEIVEKYYKRGE